MKKCFIALFGLLAMSTISCTKEEVPTVETISPVGEKITVTAYVGGNDTRVSSSFDEENDKYTFAWEDDDAFSVIGNNENQPFTKANTGDNKFIGTCPAAKNGNYYAIYPVTASTDYTKATFDISNQNDAAAYVLYSKTDNISTFDFSHAMAYLRLNLPASLNGTTCDITIITPADVYTDGTINLEDGTLDYTNSSKNYIKLTRQIDNSNPILVSIPPMSASNKTLRFLVTKDNGTCYESDLVGSNDKAIQAGKYYSANIELQEGIPYVTFTAESEQILKYGLYHRVQNNATSYSEIAFTTENSEMDLEWSYDRKRWTSFYNSNYDNGNGIKFGGGIRLFVRAKENNSNGTAVEIRDGEPIKWGQFVFANDVEVECHGDIRTLIDYQNYQNVSTSEAKFKKLFNGCTALTTAPALPATALASYCYLSMFSGCTSLTTAPELPAATLADYCYGSMFSGCTSLTTAPELPAKTLTNSCYQNMFNGCNSLTIAPELLATQLANSCYYQMFMNCASLATPPQELPATTLARSCYNSMFRNCAALISGPALRATTLADYCYGSMFSGCTNLTEAPTLPVETLVEGCYNSMFSGCTKLERAPDLPAITLVKKCYYQMFSFCTNLSYIKAMFTTVPIADYTDGWVFRVADIGTFVKNAEADWNVSGTLGVPERWTVQTQTPSASYVVNGVNYGEGIPLPGPDGSTTITWAPVNCGYDADHKYGLLYQAGRKDGQDYETDKIVDSDGGVSPDPDTYYKGWSKTEWSELNNPCPEGWRVPTFEELKSLGYNWSLGGNMTLQKEMCDDDVNHNGLYGFWLYGNTSRTDGNKVFFPAGGWIDINTTKQERGNSGFYWSSEHYVDGYFMDLEARPGANSSSLYIEGSYCAMSVRCVKK